MLFQHPSCVSSEIVAFYDSGCGQVHTAFLQADRIQTQPADCLTLSLAGETGSWLPSLSVWSSVTCLAEINNNKILFPMK